MNRHETAERIEQIALLEKELAAEKNRHLRTLADFDNYRKRVEREAASRAAQGKKELLGDLLAVLDNLERALPQIGDEGYRLGVELIHQQLTGVLTQHGLEKLDSLGREFDPHEHEAVSYTENYRLPRGYVAEELSAGYRFGRDLLRPARVTVSKGPVRTQ